MSQADSFVHYALAERARNGDHEALGELIRKHRSSMLKWANQVVRNPQKAEDIVQDALLQILKRIGTLTDPDKFQSWLRALVRNQSLMSLRRAANKREILTGQSMEKELQDYSSASYSDPQAAAMARQALEEVEGLLSKLGQRERAVVQAHALAGLSVQEVAEYLGIKSGAVYTALSRSRTKLAEARIQDEVERYTAARIRNKRPSARRIEQARYYGYAGSYNTLAAVMLISMVSMGIRDLTLTDVMGRAGYAFQIYATPDLGLSGSYAYDWADAAKKGWRSLGFSSVSFGGAGLILHQPDDLTLAMDSLFESLEQGIPAAAWQLSGTEFGLITGFNDQDRTWVVTDTTASGKRLPYTKLGRVHADQEWFVLIPRGRLPAYGANPLADIFAEAAIHIRDKGSKGTAYCAAGVTAYQLWIDALHQGTLTDPLSAAFNAAVTAEARSHAARYLESLVMAGKQHDRHRLAFPAIKEAQRLYLLIADAWAVVAKLFPLPYGADPTSPGPADRAARVLERALSTELEAAAVMEEAAYCLRR